MNYPDHLDLEVCPVCDSELDYFDNIKPSPDWEKALKLAAGQVAIMQLDEPYPPWLFVHHDDLLNLGYQYLSDFDIVELNGAKYELQGYLHESNCWWIEELVEVDEVNKLRKQLEGWHGKETA
jgi:hypothetical protein